MKHILNIYSNLLNFLNIIDSCLINYLENLEKSPPGREQVESNWKKDPLLKFLNIIIKKYLKQSKNSIMVKSMYFLINRIHNMQSRFQGATQKKLTNRDELQTNFPKNMQNLNIVVQPSQKQNLRNPYQFLKRHNAPFHTIIFPHFTWKSINFFVSLIMLIMFIVLIILCYRQQQTDLTWSCTLFRLQNKFYPRLRYKYEIWRVFVSPFFHSNISHLVLNLIGIQIYGYFIEWYYGKLRYAIALIVSIIYSHFLSCLTNAVTVSTTSSCILYTLLSMKLFFFIRYKKYSLLQGKRLSLYGLLSLVFGMNLIVLFIGSNVDYGSHIAGFINGIFFGIIFYPFKIESRWTKVARIISIIILIGYGVAIITVAFTLNIGFYIELNNAIDKLC